MSGSAEWYLVQTKSRQEKLARSNLVRQGYVVFLPCLRRPAVRRIEALFPSYVFVQLDPACDDFGPIRSTIGVLRMVRFGLVNARVPDSLVDDLRSRADADGVWNAPPEALKPGAPIEIVRGAMSGYRGTIAKLRGRERIGVLLEIAGRHVGVLARRDTVRLT